MPGGNRQGVSHAFSARVHGRPVTVAEYSTTGAQNDTTFFVIVAIAIVDKHRHFRDLRSFDNPFPSEDGVRL